MNALAFAALLIAAAYFGSVSSDGPALLCVLGAALLWFHVRPSS